MQKISLIRPDDWHVHLRDGKALETTVRATARTFARAIVMPNLPHPVDTVAAANTYRKNIIAAIPAGRNFTPLMTLYCTPQLTVEEIYRAKESGFVHGVKLYPLGATTHSAHGIEKISSLNKIFEAMQKVNLPLLLHGEVIDADVDVFDRERVFIERELAPLIARFPQLRVVLEHITTQEAADFVAAAPQTLAATITAHHLLLNRNALFVGGIRPHAYCLPVLKRAKHQAALIRAATSGNPKFFLGTDSAPHPRAAKESACGCAGIYTAHAALELYAEAFEAADALDKLEGFASCYGPDFYGLPRNTQTIALLKQTSSVPPTIPFADTQLIPFRAGENIRWTAIE